MAATETATGTAKEKTARNAFYDFGGMDFKGFEAATQTWKELVGQQLRTSQTMLEQGMTLSRKAADFWTAQTNETLKFQQEAVKYGLSLADDFRKTAFDTAERALK